MNEIKIENYRIVENGSKKPFCLYTIEIYVNGTRYVVEKRYSQFHALHEEVIKLIFFQIRFKLIYEKLYIICNIRCHFF